MAKTTNEIERKYESDDRAALPDLGALSGVAAISDPRTSALRATYFDTPDLRLARRRITLRRRTGGPDAGWHLKLPVAVDERAEVALPLTSPARVVPDELAERVRVYTRGVELAPIAQIYTYRTGRQLVDAAGSVLAEVVADRVSARTLEDAPTVTKWSEIEVELANGDRKLLTEIERALLAAGLRPARATSKLVNLLGDRVAVDGQVSGAAASADVVSTFVRTQAERLMAFDPLVRDDAPDAVHQMRVSTRRLRSALDQFDTVLDRAATRELASELRWLASVLGDVRDAEVLRERFSERLATVPDDQGRTAAAERILATLDREHEAAHEKAIAELDGSRYFALLDGLDSLVADPSYTADARKKGTAPLDRVVRRSWKKLARRASAVDTKTPEDEVHAARKAGKRFRYAVEVVSPAYGRSTKKITKAMADVQDLLGAFQDSVVARGYLDRVAEDARQAGEDTFAYGLLHETESGAAKQAVRDFPRAWQRARSRVEDKLLGG